MDSQLGWFPLNGIIIWGDFALNVKRYGSQVVTPQQSRNPKEFSNENYLVYIPKARDSIDDPVEFDVHCIQDFKCLVKVESTIRSRLQLTSGKFWRLSNIRVCGNMAIIQ